MTHFLVSVRLRKGDNLEDMLLPFKEAGCGDEDPPGLQKYLEFHDTEQEMRDDWENDSQEYVLHKNALLLSWDETFRVPGEFGIGTGTHKVPDGARRVQIPYKLIYPNFDDYCQDWHNAERNSDGKYGYWKNPNQKWDYWTERESYLAKDKDHAALNREAVDEAREFHAQWIRVCETGQGAMDSFSGPRSTALRLGLMDCEDTAKLTGKEWKVIPWERKEVNRCDIIHEPLPVDAFVDKYAAAFHPLRTWAYLDSTGWHEPGRMGWWAMSDETPEAYLNYARAFVAWLQDGDQSDNIVRVDCHI